MWAGAGWYQNKTTKKWKYYEHMCSCPCHASLDEYDQCVICDNSYADLCSPVLAEDSEVEYDNDIPLKFRDWD